MVMGFRVREHGGPEALQWEILELPPLADGDLRVRQTAIGVNFIDTYHRSGLYPLELPTGIGMEAAGVVIKAGSQAGAFCPGDRVAYATAPAGSYAEQHCIPASCAVKLPDDISDQDAAAGLLKGLTAHFLLFRTHPVQAGEDVLVQAAAGGVGTLLCAWASHLGARVIGTAGSADKAALAARHGCSEVILYREQDVAERVRSLTQGRGVRVVYDGVGASTFTASLDCLAPRGMMVSFGNASGPVQSVNPADLASRGSLSFIRPRLFDYLLSREELDNAAGQVFDAMRRGVLRPEIGQTYPLKDAARAHRDLEGRRTTGASLLIPE